MVSNRPPPQPPTKICGDAYKTDVHGQPTLEASDQPMSGPKASLLTKRHLSEAAWIPKTGSDRPAKRRCMQSSDTAFPPEFWDSLTQIDLTSRALNELNRRNPPRATYSFTQSPRSRRPTTRDYVAAPQSRPIRPIHEGYLVQKVSRTAHSLKRFARHGGPDLTSLRGYKESVAATSYLMSSDQSRPRGRSCGSCSNRRASTSNTTTSTKSTGPYNRNFQQHLVDRGIFPSEYEYPDGTIPANPVNWEAILERLGRRRPSLSPSKFSKDEFTKFKRADAHASKEKQATTSVIPFIEGRILDAKCVSGGIPLTNLDPLTDGTIVPGNPDIYYGARPEQIDRQIRDVLGGKIIPSTQHDLPAVPNFFLAAKGPGGSPGVAGRQATYDGALGARGMHSLWTYGESTPAFSNHASTITAIYQSGVLKMFTTYVAKPVDADEPLRFYTHQLNAWALTGHLDTYLSGVAAYRNGREWAEEERNMAIHKANLSAQQSFSTSDRSRGPESEAIMAGPNLAEVQSKNVETETSGTPSSMAVIQEHEALARRPSTVAGFSADLQGAQSRRPRRRGKKRQRSETRQ